VADFPLFVSGSPVNSGATNGFDADSYTASETEQYGYAASDWGGDCAADGSVTLSVGDNKTCTITNDDVAPTLTVIKVLVPATDSGTFNLQIDGTTYATGGDGTTTGAVAVNAGNHTVGETGAGGTVLSDYVTVISGDCAADGTITLSLAENKTCTITNTKKGKIIVVKQTIPDGSSQVFDFTSDFMGDFQLSDGQSQTSGFLVPGTYSVGETLPAGWALQTVVTSDGSPINALDLDPGEAITVTFTNIQASIFTDTSRCIFDRDTNLAGQQFRNIFTQDAQNWPSYKMTATNPGQFFYNVFYTGNPGDSVTFNITLPYPFVTQGANPVHGYDGLTTYTSDGFTCFTPGSEFFVSSQQVILSDYTNGTYENLPYPTGDSVGTTSFIVELTVPDSGFVFLAIHLDYGLKGSLGYGNSNNNAVQFSSLPALVYLVPDLADHTFSVGGAQTASTTVENQNTFKKNPGVGGLVLWTDLTAVQGATVTLIKDSTSAVVGTAITDDDGWYQIVYKHTGRAATFKVTLSNVPGKLGYTEPKSVILKANAYVQVDFTVAP